MDTSFGEGTFDGLQETSHAIAVQVFNHPFRLCCISQPKHARAFSHHLGAFDGAIRAKNCFDLRLSDVGWQIGDCNLLIEAILIGSLLIRLINRASINRDPINRALLIRALFKCSLIVRGLGFLPGLVLNVNEHRLRGLRDERPRARRWCRDQ